MAASLIQDVQFPGVVRGIMHGVYFNSHGISPGTVTLTTNIQDTPPAESGNVTFTDGARSVTLYDCRVTELIERSEGASRYWTLTIADRRWRWKTGAIWGRYNQHDSQNKLIPWTIRSPKELAVLCLEEMGERNYQIHLPDGLKRDDGKDIDRYLQLGENFPQTGTNPPTSWDGLPPAVALSNLAERYGCRVVFQAVANRTIIVPYGGPFYLNESLPYLSSSVGVRNPKVPMGVGLFGAETAYQVRLKLEPVGLEYGNHWVPLDELSYAPVGETTTSRWKKCCPPLFPIARATDRLSLKEAQHFARQGVWRAYRIKPEYLSGVPLRRGQARIPDKFKGARPGGASKRDAPGMREPSTYSGKGFEIPGYGVVKRRQSIILTSRQVEQVVPAPRDLGGINRDPAYAGGIMPDFYSGYARDQDARAYGEYALFIGSVWYFPRNGDQINTPANTRVRVPFTVLPDQQIILFSDFVYKLNKVNDEIHYADPELVYEGAVYIQDEETMQVCRYVQVNPITGGDGPVDYSVFDDVIVNWIGIYSDSSNFTKLTGEREEDFDDGHDRADHYLEGMLKRYQVPVAQTIIFCGTMPMDPDNAIHQVIWQYASTGPTTTVSANSEISEIIAPYPERRLRENLSPNEQAKLMNLSENYGGTKGIINGVRSVASNILGPAGRLLGG